MTHAAVPGELDQLRRRARQYIRTSQLPAAQTTLESLLKRVPNDVAARMELADVLLRQGGMRACTRQLLLALRTLPNNAPLIIQLVRRLHFCGETLAARACLDHLETAPHPPSGLLAAQAQLRWQLGDIPASLRMIERALAAGADTPEDHYLHAMVLQFTGAIEQAADVLETCLQRWPDLSDAAVILVNLRKQTEQSNHLELLRTLLQRIPLGSELTEHRYARAGFESALFKLFDDLGRHDEAWLALARSNALMHQLNPYDQVGETSVTDAFIRASRTLARIPAGPTPQFEGPVPIFIVGMPRSGTTLLDRMLSSHTQVASAGEINDLLCQLRWMTDVPPGGVKSVLEVLEASAGIDFAELGARYLKQTQWRAAGHRFYIDKLPRNVYMVHFIRRALPHAPILHMHRQPMDVCYSNFKAMFGQASAYSYDQKALAHYHGEYRRIVEHWRHTLSGAMLDVSYASLVTDPAATLQRVLAYCGLAMEAGCLSPERNVAPVATPSTVQVREAIHTRSLGAWRHYEQQLEPLRLALDAA